MYKHLYRFSRVPFRFLIQHYDIISVVTKACALIISLLGQGTTYSLFFFFRVVANYLPFKRSIRLSLYGNVTSLSLEVCKTR